MSPLPPTQTMNRADKYGDPRDWVRLSDTDPRRSGNTYSQRMDPSEKPSADTIRYQYRLNGGEWFSSGHNAPDWANGNLSNWSHNMSRYKKDCMEIKGLGLVERRRDPTIKTEYKKRSPLRYEYRLNGGRWYLSGRKRPDWIDRVSLREVCALMVEAGRDRIEVKGVGTFERRIYKPEQNTHFFTYGYALAPTAEFLKLGQFLTHFLDMLGLPVTEDAKRKANNFLSSSFPYNRKVYGHAVYRKNFKTGVIDGCGIEKE